MLKGTATKRVLQAIRRDASSEARS